GPRLPPHKIVVGAAFQGRELPGHLGAGPHRAPSTRAVDVTLDHRWTFPQLRRPSAIAAKPGPVDYWSLPPTCTLVSEGGPVWRNISCPRLCCSSRAGVGHRTLWAHPKRSNTRISSADRSIWPRSTPCRAQAGSEWCMLCQLSPSDSTASGHKLVARSWRRVVKGRLPSRVHREFTLQVTCCSRKTRTSPAHTSASSAASQVPPSAHPAANGSASDTTHNAGKARDTRRIDGDASMSGAKRCCGVGSLPNSHPTWACRRPRNCPASPAPYRYDK